MIPNEEVMRKRTPKVEEVLLRVLRDAREPVREAVLYERLRARGVEIEPEDYLALTERLAVLGHLHIAVEHDLPARDPAPFRPRFYYPAD
jgi:hypothetical protein